MQLSLAMEYALSKHPKICSKVPSMQREQSPRMYRLKVPFASPFRWTMDGDPSPENILHLGHHERAIRSGWVYRMNHSILL